MSITSNTTKIINYRDLYNVTPTVECYKLQMVGVICCLLFAAGVFFNGILLLAFMRHKHLRTPINYYIIGLTILNFIGSLFELPFIMVSNLYCK